MKSSRKAILSRIGALALAMLLFLPTCNLQAAEANFSTDAATGMREESTALLQTGLSFRANSSEVEASKSCSSQEEAASFLRQCMVNRYELIRVSLGEEIDDVDDFYISQILAHTGDPDEGDSLLCMVDEAGYDDEVQRNGRNTRYVYTFYFTYYDTLAQENALNTKLTALIHGLNPRLEGQNNAVKAKILYDYICQNVTYDEAHCDDDSYLLQFTAYAALCQGTAVCQGIANLYYRMCLMAGVDCRMVSSNDMNHCWNIVEMGGEYYQCDPTWGIDADDSMDYLMKETKFDGHAGIDQYSEEYVEYYNSDFIDNYPLANVDYGYSKKELAATSNINIDWGITVYKDQAGDTRAYYNADKSAVINSFVCDGTYTYYIQADGTAMTDRLTYHPDGEHIIYFDADGHEVFNDYHHVSKSIAGDAVDDQCFFNVYGYLYVDVLTWDQTGTKLLYANAYGRLECDGWFQFSDTVTWADGTACTGIAGGYGYGQYDCTLLRNTYTYDWNGNSCYMQGNGVKY